MVDADEGDWDALIAEQIAYYKARAPEYDEWWERTGPYDLGPEFERAWRREVAELESALDTFDPVGDVLELAAGTGMFTEQLAKCATRLTAIDSSAEALAINGARMADSSTPVDYIEADLFQWEPPRRYDAVCFAFWLTHIPPPRFDGFWSFVERALKPGGRFFFVDNATPPDELPGLGRRFARHGSTIEGVDTETDLETGIAFRRLRDGRQFRAIKVYWSPDALEARLSELGWSTSVRATEWAFIHGSGARTGA
jgi:demethylmenaquinone methyltransferase/2-methoxy-6-polyprenyl-1,4-benzoquinol methylase